MSIINRAIAERGPDKLLESIWRLTHYADELVRLAAADCQQPALATAEALRAELGKLEGLFANMQTSAVRLPDPSRTSHPVWVVPVRTETQLMLSAHSGDELAKMRCFRIEFVRDGSGPTWKWLLREHELDTGIPVKF